MLIKKKNKQNLDRFIPRFVDIGKNSPNFFNITYMPDVFTAGKNVIKFRPYQQRFSSKDPILIEILDFNGEPIYHEILDYRDSDGSLVLAIYIYEDTPPGNCLITFVGTSLYDEDLSLIPNRELYSYNFRYRTVLHVDPIRRNDSEIIYTQPPVFTVKERKYSVVERQYSGSQFAYANGTSSYDLIDNRYKFTSKDNSFKKEFENGRIKLTTLSDQYRPSVDYTTSSFYHTSSISSVKTPYEFEIKDGIKLYGTQGQQRVLTNIQNQLYEVTYSAAPISRRITQNDVSYAQIDISGMDPATGTVSRVKVFAKSTFKPESDYELIYDDEISIKNKLTDTGSHVIEYPIGKFDENQIYTIASKSGSFYLNTVDYWEVSQYLSPSASKKISSGSLFGGLSLEPTGSITGSSELILTQTASIQIPFYKDTDYRIKFDYHVQSHPSESRVPKIEVYGLGDCFVDDSPFGKFVGSIPTGTNVKTIDFDYELKLPINSDGNGRIRFVLRPGCTISNIRIVEDIDFGFTPNRTRLYVPTLQEHRNEYLDFKIQFFNYTLKESNKYVETFNVPFEGGNYYIYGSNNIITGSVFISSFSSSGIELYGNTQERDKRDLYSWGYNTSGQLGDGTQIDKDLPTQISGSNWKTVYFGGDHSLGIKDNGTLWGWGYNTSLITLGHGITNYDVLIPTRLGTGSNWSRIAAGYTFSLVQDVDGKLYSWGKGGPYLGVGDSSDRSTITNIHSSVSNSIWLDFDAGANFGIAVKNDNTLWSWGANGDYQLGDGTTTTRMIPTQIGTSSNWLNVSAGELHSLAIKTDGTLWGWGKNDRGQLGVGSTASQTSPTQIGTGSDWKEISAGGFMSLGIKQNGTLWAWGEGYLGNINTTSQSLVPIQIGTGSNWVKVATTKVRESILGTFTIAIRNVNDDYELWTWGNNNAGQLADGNSPTDNGTPTSTGHSSEYVGDGGRWDIITAGYFSAAGIYSTPLETSGSTLRSAGFNGIQNAIEDPYKPTNFGWGFATGDPYKLGYSSSVAVEMINECGDLFDFRTGETGSAFNLALVGEHSWAVIGISGSSGQIGYGGTDSDCLSTPVTESYIKWDGSGITIKNATFIPPITGSGTSGTGGTPGSSGTSGTSGTSGISGTSGTSGTSGDRLCATYAIDTYNIGGYTNTGSFFTTGGATILGNTITDLYINGLDYFSSSFQSELSSVGTGRTIGITFGTSSWAYEVNSVSYDSLNNEYSFGVDYLYGQYLNLSNGTTGSICLFLGAKGASGTGSVVVNNPGQNRILVSDGTQSGITASTNLTFDQSLLLLNGTQKITGSLFVSNSGYFHELFMTNSYVHNNLYVCGSTVFGSSSTSTHQFTGSVTVTGSLAVFGSLILPSTPQLPAISTTGSIVVFQDDAYLYL